MKEWLIAGWLHLVIGFAVGWVVFKRPAFVQTFIDKIKAKF